MDEAAIAFLGAAATALSVLSLLPQAWRTWRTRSARDISAGWLAAAIAGAAMWIAYAALVGAPAVIWANVLTLGQFVFILAIKVATERRPAGS